MSKEAGDGFSLCHCQRATCRGGTRFDPMIPGSWGSISGKGVSSELLLLKHLVSGGALRKKDEGAASPDSRNLMELEQHTLRRMADRYV